MMKEAKAISLSTNNKETNPSIHNHSTRDIQDNKKVCLLVGHRENSQSNLQNFKIGKCKLESGNGLILLLRALVRVKEVVILLL